MYSLPCWPFLPFQRSDGLGTNVGIFFADLCPPAGLHPSTAPPAAPPEQHSPGSTITTLQRTFSPQTGLSHICPTWRFASPPQFCGSRPSSISTARPCQGRVPCAWPCREPPPPTSSKQHPQSTKLAVLGAGWYLQTDTAINDSLSHRRYFPSIERLDQPIHQNILNLLPAMGKCEPKPHPPSSLVSCPEPAFLLRARGVFPSLPFLSPFNNQNPYLPTSQS